MWVENPRTRVVETAVLVEPEATDDVIVRYLVWFASGKLESSEAHFQNLGEALEYAQALCRTSGEIEC